MWLAGAEILVTPHARRGGSIAFGRPVLDGLGWPDLVIEAHHQQKPFISISAIPIVHQASVWWFSQQ